MVIGVDASRAVTRQRTGTEAYAYFLIQTLIPLASEHNCQLRLYFNQPPHPDLFLQANHVEHVTIPLPRLWTHGRLAWELARCPPDVFYTPAHVIPYGQRVPSVATIHDVGFHFFPETHTRSQRTYLNWSTRHNGQNSRRVIVDSKATMEDLIRLYNLNPAKIDVIYPGIDPELRPVTDVGQLTAVQNKYGVIPPYLLYIGTLQPRKNLSRLIQAYMISHVDHQLVIAGKIGWRAKSLLDEIKNARSSLKQRGDFSGEDRLLLPGYIADHDKAALISGAEALLFPSLYEGFGFPVVEGNVCGTPVLCSNTSSLPEISNGAALEVDPLDLEGLATGIQRITGDEDLRHQLVSAGIVNARRFSWETAAIMVLATLKSAGS